MAHLRRGIVGPIQGGIDGLIGRVIYGKGVIQSKGETGQNSTRLGTTVPQDKMFWLRWWTTQITDDYWDFVLKPKKKIWTSRNQWIKMNFDCVDLDGNYTPSPNSFSYGKKQAPIAIEVIAWDSPTNCNTKLIIDEPNANTIPDALAVFAQYNFTKKMFGPDMASSTFPFTDTGLSWAWSDVGDECLIIAWFMKFPDKSGLVNSPAVYLPIIVGG